MLQQEREFATRRGVLLSFIMTSVVTRGAKRRAERRSADSVVARLDEDLTTSYWHTKIPWYPNGCFGPYRSPSVGYSRRELAADGLVHAIGLVGGAVAIVYLLATMDDEQLPAQRKPRSGSNPELASLPPLPLANRAFDPSRGQWPWRCASMPRH